MESDVTQEPTTPDHDASAVAVESAARPEEPPEPGGVEWLLEKLAASGDEAGWDALDAALVAELPEGADAGAALAAMRVRVAHVPSLVALRGDRVGLTRRYLQSAYFRYTPSTWELEQGALRLDGTELALVCAQGAAGLDREVCWRGVDEHEARTARLARSDDRWVLPGLGVWFDHVGFTFGDDVVIHVRDIDAPLFVFDRESRFDRDEGPIARRNAALAEAAIQVLAESGEAWMSVDRLVKLLVARFDFRAATAPDSFRQRLLEQDNRFTLALGGREVRLSHFHHEDTARAYLSGLHTPTEALPAFLEEYPPRNGEDREKALAYLESLWRHTPRPEHGGLTIAQWEEAQSKIVPFGPRAPKT